MFGFALAAILALGIRLAYLFQIRSSPLTDVLVIDSETYDRLARLILNGAYRGEEVYAMNVLYPFFLAAVYAMSDASRFAVLLVQALLDTGSLCLMAWIGIRFFDRRTALAAAFAYALYAPLVFYTGALLTPTLITFLCLSTLALLVRYRSGGRPAWALAAGVALGLSALGRGNTLLLVPLAGVFFRTERGSWRRALRDWGVFAAGAALVVGAVTLRNYWVERKIVPVAANYAAFYIGHHDASSGLYTMPSFTESASFDKEVWGTRDAVSEILGRPVTLAESSQYLFNEGLRYALSHPLKELRLCVAKVYFFWNRTESPTNLNFYFALDHAPILRWLPLHLGIVAPLGLLGVALSWKERRKLAILLLFALIFPVTCVLFFVSAEYRAPIVPVLLLFGASAIFRLWVMARGKRRRPQQLFKWLAVLAIFFIACNVRTPLLRAQSLKRVDYLNFGTLYRLHGNFEASRRMLLRSIAIDPRYAPAYASLSETLLLLGDEMEAARMAQTAAQFRPSGESGPVVSSALMEAGSLYEAGRHAEALARFTALLQEAEASGDRKLALRLRNNVGLCRWKLGELEAASATFTAIIEEDSTYVKAYNNLAKVRETEGRLDEALSLYRRALEIEPGNPPAERGLAKYLARPGTP